MSRFFLGVDVGSTKTHALITGELGQLLGFGESGPGNPEAVGYAGLGRILDQAVTQALQTAGLRREQIAGAGFGISGYDWPSQRAPVLQAIAPLTFDCPVEVVNDAILGLLAGASEGWGIAVVSGTGCNCRGWDREHREEGRVTGNGFWMGEGAGGSELVTRAIQAVVYEWTQRGPTTQLTGAFLNATGSKDVTEMLDALVNQRATLGAAVAPLVFQTASAGDPVAIEVIRWAGIELGELANCVIRQLKFEMLDFDVVLVGSMFDGGPMLTEPMRQTILALAPGARLVRLENLPVTGAVLLGMEAAGIKPAQSVRQALSRIGKPRL
jgi:N-acetylglucosamine kinase-like BadF-type ATPase